MVINRQINVKLPNQIYDANCISDLYLHHSQKEIANKLGCSPGLVKKQLKKYAILKTKETLINLAYSKFANKFVYRTTPNTLDDIISIECPIHGVFTKMFKKHLTCENGGCVPCNVISRRLKYKNQYLAKFKDVHGNKYDYSKFEYITAKTKSTIICPVHGKFEQEPFAHSLGGCRKCADLNNIDKNLYDPTSLYYDPDRITYIYLLKLDNHEESFHKIGVSVNIDNRMSTIKSESGYDVTLLDKIETTVKDALDVESKLHIMYNQYKYTPLIYFGGYTECFKLKGTKL